MHVYTILKVKADNPEDAIEQANGLIEQSCDLENNTAGWDYGEAKEVITPEFLKSDYKVKSYEALERHYTRDRNREIRRLSGQMRDEIEKYLKKHPSVTGRSKVDLITEVVTSMSRTHGMLEYYVEQIHKLQDCIEYPQEQNCTLQCTNNYFADCTKDTMGSKIFYVRTDRHF